MYCLDAKTGQDGLRPAAAAAGHLQRLAGAGRRQDLHHRRRRRDQRGAGRPEVRGAGRERPRRVHAQLAGRCPTGRSSFAPTRSSTRSAASAASAVMRPTLARAMAGVGSSLVVGDRGRACARRAGAVAAQQAQAGVRMIADEGEARALLAALARAVRAGARRRHAAIRTPGRPPRTCCGRSPVPGSGNSSPIVWRDRIFLTTAHDGGRRLSVLAFRRARRRAALGDVRAGRARASRPHYKNGYASATPATDGERDLRVVRQPRADGARHERQASSGSRDLGRDRATTTAPAGSPLLYKDRVILYQDQSRGSFVAAFDTRTGKQLWRTPRDAQVGWGTPIAVRVGDHDEIIVNSQNARAWPTTPTPGASCGAAAACASR